MPLDPAALSELTQLLIEKTLEFTPKLVMAVVILVLFRTLYRVTNGPASKALRKTGFDKPLVDLLIGNIYRLTIVVLACVMAAGQLGIDVGAALAGIGVAGIAIGFAAQDTISNVIAGFMIFIDKPFMVDDWIAVSDHYGRVQEITLRSTRIRTLNNTYVVIPNKIIVDEILDNHSKNGETRIEIPVGIAYKEDIAKAREVLLSAVKDLEDVDDNPAPDVVVAELGDSSVNLLVRVWTEDASKERAVFYRAMEASKLALDTAGIEIPFPHLQLFVDDVKAGVLKKGNE